MRNMQRGKHALHVLDNHDKTPGLRLLLHVVKNRIWRVGCVCFLISWFQKGGMIEKGVLPLVLENKDNQRTELTETRLATVKWEAVISHFRKKSTRFDSLAWVKLHTSAVKPTSTWICATTTKKTFHCIQNTANPKTQTVLINLPCTGSHCYLIETHDILGRTARIDRGKDGFLGERRN